MEAFSFPSKKKEKKREEKEMLQFWFFSYVVYALYRKQQGPHAAEPDLWADALHPLYREQVQGEALPKVRDWTDNRQTKNNTGGKRWREKQERTEVNRDNIMKERGKE